MPHSQKKLSLCFNYDLENKIYIEFHFNKIGIFSLKRIVNCMYQGLRVINTQNLFVTSFSLSLLSLPSLPHSWNYSHFLSVEPLARQTQ